VTRGVAGEEGVGGDDGAGRWWGGGAGGGGAVVAASVVAVPGITQLSAVPASDQRSLVNRWTRSSSSAAEAR
jgi:hypothetical protein